MTTPKFSEERPVEKKTYPIETFALVLNDPIVDPEKLKLGYSYIVDACGYSIVSPDIVISADYDIDKNRIVTVVGSRIVKCANIKVHVNDTVQALTIFETNKVEAHYQ